MDAIRFDALARFFAANHARRSLLGTVTGSTAISFLARFGEVVEAGCKKVGAHCKKSGNCCAGAHCRHGRCRCKKGRANCNGGGFCRNLATDSNNCGACDQACSTDTGDCGPCAQSCDKCCVGGACRPLCGGDCCGDCFAEADGLLGPPNCGTEACCPDSLLCNSGTGDPEDDVCCWPDEVCLNGSCCCDGCLGTTFCGGTCCPSVSCCNGSCCGAGQVCAQVEPNKPKSCVDADRSCGTDDECFEGEVCWGGTCCFGDRLCLELGPNTDPFCCALGKYCDPELSICCANGNNCNTGKKVRIRV